jgi:hypothetical protein
MARGDQLTARLLDRIAESAHTLTIYFPPDRPAVSGTLSGPAVNPLTGGVATPGLQATEPVSTKSPVTVQCLWYESIGTSDYRYVTMTAQAPKGWQSDTGRIAQVKATDVAQGLGTIFDACDYVDHAGNHFAVAGVSAQGASFSAAHSYYVWLKGRINQ